MYKKSNILFVLSFFVCTALFAQKQNLKENYEAIRSGGEIPTDFTTRSTDKYAADIERIENASRKEKKSQKEFLLNSNFYLDRYIQSGNVLFGDPVTNYINKVADKLLASEPKLRSELRFYTTKSTEVNAFATNQGMVFVNIGLIAQVQNEAQLAFVLAHEIAHYVKKHSINSYVEQKSMARTRDFKGLSESQKELVLSNYSKENEFEADVYALEMLRKTEYAYEAFEGVLDVLQYSYLPFDEVPLDSAWFQSKYYKFPGAFLPDTINKILGNDDFDDDKSSHPNIRKRREAFEEYIEENNKFKGTKSSLLSEQEFEYVQDLCRFEMTRIYLLNLRYARTLYNVFLLSEKYPDNLFLKEVKAKSLMYTAIYKTNKTGDDLWEAKAQILDIDTETEKATPISKNNKNIEGEISAMFHLLANAGGEDMAILAAKSSWESINNKNKDRMLPYATYSIETMVRRYGMNPKDFYRNVEEMEAGLKENKPKEEETEEFEDESEEKEDTKSKKKKGDKYSKIKKKKTVSTNYYYKSAFIELGENAEDFWKLFESKFEEYKEDKEKARELLAMSLKEKSQYKKQFYKELKQNKKEESRKIAKLLVLNPFYLKAKNRDGDVKETAFQKAEAQNFVYMNYLREFAGKLNMEVTVLSNKELEEKDLEKFNDFALMKEWLSENLSHGDHLGFSSQSVEIKAMMEKYNCNHLMVTGVLNVDVGISDFLSQLRVLTFLSVFASPIGVYLTVRKYHNTSIFSVVYNTNSGDKVYSQSKTITHNDKKDYLRSIVYETLFNVKNRK
jgi:hypothetical protein